MQRQFRLGGGVAPKMTRLRGQGLIEYVLIIAVIGLVIVFAGPGVAGAIRNQFNLVGNTVNNGTTGGVEGGGASGGGSTGTDSATIQAAVAKDAKDWTLDEQKAVAEDIAAKGEASHAYAKAKAAMDAGTEFSMKLTNGDILKYRIIGINHDDLADGSGKAGLTFLTTSPTISSYMCYKGSKSNAGGWEFSDLRAKMNSGEIWNLMPSDFQSKVKAVRKLTNNVGGGDENRRAAVTPTSDKLFLLSYSETVNYIPTGLVMDPDYSMYSWLPKEGSQYEAFQGKVSPTYGNSFFKVEENSWASIRLGRSSCPTDQDCFMGIFGLGDVSFYRYIENDTKAHVICPVFCF